MSSGYLMSNPNTYSAPVPKQQPEAYVEVVKGEPLMLGIKAEGESSMSYTGGSRGTGAEVLQ